MSLAWIRKTYGVPAKRGGRIRFTLGRKVWGGTIKSAKNGRLSVQLDESRKSCHGRMILHPTWNVEYLGAP